MRDRARMSMRRGTAAVVPFFVLFGLAAAGAGAAQPPDALVVAQSSTDRKSTRLNSSHSQQSRMPSSA